MVVVVVGAVVVVVEVGAVVVVVEVGAVVVVVVDSLDDVHDATTIAAAATMRVFDAIAVDSIRFGRACRELTILRNRHPPSTWSR